MKKRRINLLVIGLSILSISCSMWGKNIDNLPGELIVCIEDEGIASIQSQDKDAILGQSVFQKGDFKIKDNLLESTGLLNSGQAGAFSSDENFKKEVIENMGYTYLVEYPEDKLDFEQAKIQLQDELQKAGYKVKSIEPNYILEAIEDEEIESYEVRVINSNQKWHYEMIKLPDAWEITAGDKNTKVAILDTGIDYNHPSLKNYVDVNLGKNFATGSNTDIMDRQGHGTHVAGTIASEGSVSGVMQEASLLPIKVLGDNGKGSLYGIEQGVLYAANQKADVINMSLGGGGYSSSFESACKTATANGTIVVAATGNEYASSISYPAAYECVISVGGVDVNKRRAVFSNYGTGLDLMAPGDGIYSTIPNAQYTRKSGTSMACPHVSGVVGLMRSLNKNIGTEQARNMLKETAQPAGNAQEYGAGIVDAFAVLQTISGTKPVEKVDVPQFSLKEGTYYAPQQVTLSCKTQGAVIRYTTDGMNPTESSNIYSEPLTINTTTTLTAQAFKESMKASDVISIQYIIEDKPTEPEDPQDPTVSEWKENAVYKVGDIVVFKGEKYICRQAHTSLVGWEPSNVPALWEKYVATAEIEEDETLVEITDDKVEKDIQN